MICQQDFRLDDMQRMQKDRRESCHDPGNSVPVVLEDAFHENLRDVYQLT
jgi:hypothetical protein